MFCSKLKHEQITEEIYHLNNDQITQLKQKIQLIQNNTSKYNVNIFWNNKNSTQLKIIFYIYKYRLQIISEIERHLGSIFLIITKNKIIFPLTFRQKKLLADDRRIKALTKEIRRYATFNLTQCKITDDESQSHPQKDENKSSDFDEIVLNINNNVPTIDAIHIAEKRLGVLMTYQEITNIMKQLKHKQISIENKTKLKEFYVHMMDMCDNGSLMFKWMKNGQCCLRYILISDDRLYWKIKKKEKNSKKRSMHLTKIIQVLIGKQTKAFKNAPPDLKEDHCFTIVTKNATLDLSANTALECKEMVAYVKILKRHFIDRANEATNV